MKTSFAGYLMSYFFLLAGSAFAADSPQLTGNCSPATEDAVKSYFLPIKDKTYRYDTLGATDSGQGNDIFKSITYTSSNNRDGEFNALLKTVAYLGSMKIKSSEVYSIACNKVHHTANENEVFGAKTFSDRPVVLILPVKGKDTHWTWSNEGERHKYSATFVDKVVTPLRVFSDVLLVSDEDNSVNVVTKSYYAKGYGLVKEECFDKKGHTVSVGSSQLVRID